MAKVYKHVRISEDKVPLNRASPIDELHLIVTNSPVQSEQNDRDLLKQFNEQEKKEAFSSGFEQGLAEGMNQTNNQMAEQTSVLKSLIESIPASISAHRLELSSEIADIVLVVIKQFFINQQLNKDEITLQINQAINLLNDKQNIELFLHPKDIALLQQGLISIDLQQCNNLRISPDENLRLGGCIIHSKHGVFDAGIERQIDSLKQALLQIKQGNRRE